MMRKIIILMLSLVFANSAVFAADYYAKPTVSMQLNVKNYSDYPYGNDYGKIFLYAQNIQGNVAYDGQVLVQPQDGTVDYILRSIRPDKKFCILTITTTHGYATASVKNLESFTHCKIQGDLNGTNFTFIIY